MRRIRTIVLLLFGCLAVRVAAGEPEVVDNSARGLWDEEPRKNFHLLEELYVAGDDEENGLIFGRIADVAVDSRDRMLILDGDSSCVKVYDPDSMIVHTIGGKGAGPGEFNQPTAIGVDAEDRIYVASQGGRVGIFDSSGKWIEEFRHKFPGAAVITNLRVFPKALYIACFDPVGDKVVHRYDAQHTYLSSFSDSWSVVKPMQPDEEFAWNGGAIDVDAGGYVYYTQFTPCEIRKFSPAGELLLTIHRENTYLKPPRVERHADGATFYSYSMSVGIVALDDGKFINVVRYLPNDIDLTNAKTVLDLFDAEGRLLKSMVKEGRVTIRCRDAKGRLYAIEEHEVPEVVRYRLQLP
jgi:hypothetical protein